MPIFFWEVCQVFRKGVEYLVCRQIRTYPSRKECTVSETIKLKCKERQLTVLLIDDLAPVLEVFEAALTASGYKVLTALCGLEGLNLFRDNPVDIILCDLGMPRMNGWEVAKAIRNTCEKQKLPKPPFLLVTAWAYRIHGDREMAEAGVDAVLGKPVSLMELVQAMERALEGPHD
jgi:CheY-like chemotaxis protein